ncbi:TIGR02922 family protein [Litorilituus sediminis]|uniref:TIGR02922 family protein n=1 Tax=Litorilituus sediminis TaxID=718192 RepID=A0A4P6P140_9GAMM|nr:TIGR02922 family protein [Litorilituus sediminis]QBG34761.1 TIGR02922 family protein [Litorilituus sediminis]
MGSDNLTTVTIIYYNENCIELQHEVKTYPKSESGRVIIPQDFKDGKSIVAVCLGEIVILNKVGDRVIAVDIDE